MKTGGKSWLLCCIGLVGLAISYVLSMTGLLSGVVTYFTETEKQMVSVERIDQYISDVPEECHTESVQVLLLLHCCFGINRGS